MVTLSRTKQGKRLHVLQFLMIMIMIRSVGRCIRELLRQFCYGHTSYPVGRQYISGNTGLDGFLCPIIILVPNSCPRETLHRVFYEMYCMRMFKKVYIQLLFFFFLPQRPFSCFNEALPQTFITHVPRSVQWRAQLRVPSRAHSAAAPCSSQHKHSPLFDLMHYFWFSSAPLLLQEKPIFQTRPFTLVMTEAVGHRKET